jgi:GrpB-like predicted nucleotidyltransferase (UPF0157 family)
MPDSCQVTVVDSSPAWPDRFAALAARALAAIAPIKALVEHVGSTAVPGLAAKPIIDLDVVVAPADLHAVIARLATLGYVHQGDQGIPGREAFRWPAGEERHHLYVCRTDASAYHQHIAFRDYLRHHPETANAYAALKRALAASAPDREAYQSGKAQFIEAVTRRATGGDP